MARKSSRRRSRRRGSTKRRRSRRARDSRSKRSRKGRTAASRAGRSLREEHSSEAGRLLGEIGEDIRHEGYRRPNMEVEVEEYDMGGGTRRSNPTKRLANRLMR